MLALAPGTMAIYFCIGATDMRKGFDGLMRLAEQQAARDVLQGGLFSFVNRRRDRVKLLWWDEDGLRFGTSGSKPALLSCRPSMKKSSTCRSPPPN